MAEVVALICEGWAVSPDASEQMYRALTKPFWDDEALSQVPPTIHVACKNGSVNAAKSEVVLVHAPSGEYVFCVIVKNQQNKGTEYDNDGYVLIRDVSRMLWQHFEPDTTWQPEPDAKRWAKPDW